MAAERKAHITIRGLTATTIQRIPDSVERLKQKIFPRVSIGPLLIKHYSEKP
jgi:hypothetical protein